MFGDDKDNDDKKPLFDSFLYSTRNTGKGKNARGDDDVKRLKLNIDDKEENLNVKFDPNQIDGNLNADDLFGDDD